jgi:hypothetical protein
MSIKQSSMGWRMGRQPPELRDRIDCTQGGINKGLRRLCKAKKIILIERARSAELGRSAMYALAGTATPYVFTRDAIIAVLRTRKKMTVPELVAAARKKLSAINAALVRLEDDGVVIRVGLRGRFTVFALSTNRRRRHASITVAFLL